MALISEVVVCDTYHITSVSQLRDALNALLEGLPEGADPDLGLSADFWISLLQGRNQHGEIGHEIDFRVAAEQPGMAAAIKADIETRNPSVRPSPDSQIREEKTGPRVLNESVKWLRGQ